MSSEQKKIEYTHSPHLSHEKGIPLHSPRYEETLMNDQIVAFWRPPGFLNQWTYVQFEMDGIKFNCAEQAMMYRKAKLFGDEKAAAKILAADHPKKYFSIGRSIKNFDEEKWNENKFTIVVEVNLAKFRQNPLYLEALLDTGDRTLIEASPLDGIWGVKADPETVFHSPNPLSYITEENNLLGKALMQTRSITCSEKFVQLLD